jgi:hypothetical protein
MQEPSTPEPDETLAGIESAIHAMLLVVDEQRPWSICEVQREIGSDVTDALRSLEGRGLLHRCGEFVWATRAALAADEIAL